MDLLQAFILGLAQGLGEFLPISSSAHLVLIPWLFHWPDPGLTFDIALHIGTLFAVIVYFFKDWITLIREGITHGFKTPQGRLFWFLVIATIPGALSGMLFESQAETAFRNPLIIAVMLIIMGFLLYIGDFYGSKRHQTKNISFGQSFGIGLSQALSIIPGVSRSGITITTGLLLGLTREDAARFSFLLSTPIILGAGLLKLRHLSVATINSSFIIGFLTSAIVGFLVIAFLLRWLRKSNFLPFVWYRLLLGISVLIIFLARK